MFVHHMVHVLLRMFVQIVNLDGVAPNVAHLHVSGLLRMTQQTYVLEEGHVLHRTSVLLVILDGVDPCVKFLCAMVIQQMIQ
jgi:hypothetical protein